ncbi:MAG TPA: MFS transporter [Thermomicrobiales bacterium]|nr:MFS transporter [Thermomicrobiales bacterium]
MDRRELLLAVYLPTVLLAFTQGVIVLSLPLLANETSDAYSFASIIVSAAAFGTLIADVPTGTVMLRLGLRRTMLIGSLLVALSTWALAIPLDAPAVLALRLAAGIGTALWGLSRYTYITQKIPPELRGRTIAGFGGINRIGVFAGPMIAGSLVTAYGLYSAFLLAGTLAAFAFAAAWRWIPGDAVAPRPPDAAHHAPDTGEIRGTWNAIAGNRSDVLFGALAQVLAQVVRQGRHFLIPLYGVEVLSLEAVEVGLVMTASAVIDMVMFGPAGFLMDRFGRKFATIPSFSVMAVGIAMIPFAGGFTGLLAAGIVIGFGNGLGSGTMMTLGADFAPSAYTSTFLSLWRFIGDSGQMIGPILVGVVAQLFTLRQSAWVLSGCSVTCALMLFFLVRETRREHGSLEATEEGTEPEPVLQKQGG